MPYLVDDDFATSSFLPSLCSGSVGSCFSSLQLFLVFIPFNRLKISNKTDYFFVSSTIASEMCTLYDSADAARLTDKYVFAIQFNESQLLAYQLCRNPMLDKHTHA